MSKKKGIYFLLLHITLLMIACSEQEIPAIKPDITLPANKVRLRLNIDPKDYTIPSGRAAANEDDITDATWVLVFEGTQKDNSVFTEAVKADLTSEGTFVMLTKSSVNSYLLIIANSPAQFYNGEKSEVEQFTEGVLASSLSGKTLSQAENILQTTHLSQPSALSVPYDGTLIPMSALAEVPEGIGNGTIITNSSDGKLYLKRIVAKTNIYSSAPNFELYSATAIKAPCTGNFVFTETTLPTCTKLTDYPVAEISNPAKTLYIYESPKNNETSLIIKGKYKGNDYYYRLGFVDASGNLMDILRNKHYKFEITSVTGPGKETLEEAGEGPITNIDYQLVVLDDNSHDILSNGRFYLGVSNSELVVYGEGNQTNILAFSVQTDALASWGITKNVISSTGPGLTLVDPVENGTINLSAAKGSPAQTEVKISLSSSFTNGSITIRLDDLMKTIKIVRRQPLSYIGVEAVSGNFVSGVITARGDGQDWLSLSSDGLVTAADEVSLPSPGTIYIMAPSNVSTENGTNRTGGEFFLSRNNEEGRVKFIVSQECLNTNEVAVTPYGYIGAFWRQDQTGERLIRIPHQSGTEGAWSALVISGQDWIKLDTEESSDVNIGWKNTGNEASVADMNVSGNDALHQVMGSATSVTGDLQVNGVIYFRIGLNSKFQPTSDNAARYGVILLSYNNNTKFSKIYIRQGADADYLMKNSTARPLARKFSPYNTTAPVMTSGGNLNHEHPHVDLNKGAFTNYPTQAGAYFQYANSSNQRFAYHPVNPPGSISGWNSGYVTGFWGNWGLANSYESCPKDYRRPYDGSITSLVPITTTNVNDSEMRQSLYLNPQNGVSSNRDNVLYGYYADGFFDRRKIVNNASVCVSDYRIGYVGYLFFNPDNNHSLFFPLSGLRSNTNGSLEQTGTYSAYWSGSILNDSDAWVLELGSNSVRQNHLLKSRAVSIRCVKAD